MEPQQTKRPLNLSAASREEIDAHYLDVLKKGSVSRNSWLRALHVDFCPRNSRYAPLSPDEKANIDRIIRKSPDIV